MRFLVKVALLMKLYGEIQFSQVVVNLLPINIQLIIIQYFGIEEDDIIVKVIPLDTKHGEHSTEERVFMVKSNEKYRGTIDVELAIRKLDIFYNMRYKMDYNMKQADGFSFIDHCYSQNEWDILDDSGMMSMLCVSPDCFDDIDLLAL